MVRRIAGMFLILILFSGVNLYAGQAVSIFWAEYDGDTPEYTQQLEKAFEGAHPGIDLKIIRTSWNNLHDRLVTSIKNKSEPDLSVIGTRWLLEFEDLDVLEPIEQHLNKSLLDNIDPSSMEGKIDATLYGLPVAMGTRIMYYRPDLVGDPPATFEELREKAKRAHHPPGVYGVGMVGRRYVENTDFVYYLYANGGDYFHTNENGSIGASALTAQAAITALTFMNDLVNKDKITQPDVGSYGRDEVQDLFLAGKLAFFFGGGQTASLLKKKEVSFKWDVAQIPAFAGHEKSSLLVTDSIVMFKRSKNKKAAADFLAFFYKDKWRLGFDKNTGFPPVTKSLGNNEAFQSPVYKTMVASTPGAKGWPLIAEWPRANDIIWEAIENTFQGDAAPKDALVRAAQKIDHLRKE